MVKPNATKKSVVKDRPIQANITIENAKIAFRNFEGKAGTFNAAGQRNFCVLLDREVAKDLKAIGWNIKLLKPREEGEEPQPFLQVKVSYDKIPPKIVLITTRSQKILVEENVHILDWAEIKSIDLIIKPYNWEANGNTGVKAYVKTMYVIIVEDEFARKYENVPDSAASSLIESEDD